MKYALIVPPPNLQIIDEFHLGYHFILAQYCKDPVYRDFYKQKHEQGHFIMMDNGAAELGASIDIKDVVEAANEVGADEIVMPDVLDDYVQTLQRTANAVEFVSRKQRAMVPQATNWKDWETCARLMINMGCATLCVAKRYEKFPGGRSHALKIIMDHGWDRTHNIHLLGCYKNPLREIRAAYRTMCKIRGVDTGAAIAYTQCGMALNFSGHCSLNWKAPFEPDLARHNIDLYLHAHEENHAHNN